MSEPIEKKMKKHPSGVKGVTFERNEWKALYYLNNQKKYKYFPVGSFPRSDIEGNKRLYESAKQRAISFRLSIENENKTVEPVHIPVIEPDVEKKDDKKMYCESCMYSYHKQHEAKHLASNRHKQQGLDIVRYDVDKKINTYICYFAIDGVRKSKFFSSFLIGDEEAKKLAIDYRKQMVSTDILDV